VPTPSRAQPEQHAPPVQRLRVRYAKRGRARFTSHRDFGRAFERALRRAGIPMAYSSGFSPHPRISYANASPTGAASEAEYLEIGLAARCDPAEVRRALDAALPDGLDVIEVVPSPPGALADQLTGSRWRIDLPELVGSEDLAAAVSAFVAVDSVLVQRMTKNGMRTFDARAAVVELVGVGREVTVTLVHQVPLVRPDDVVLAIQSLTPSLHLGTPLLTRIVQGRLVSGTATILEP
jgi:radical SAM-linked protein